MNRFRISHLLLAGAVISALLGWLQLRLIWQHENVVQALDSRTVETDDGPVTQLYNRELIFYYSDGEEERSAPPVRKRTGYLIVIASFVVSIVGLLLTGKRSGPVRFFFTTIRLMALAIILPEIVIFLFLAVEKWTSPVVS